MPFLRAGFNPGNWKTGIRGWTRPLQGRRSFAPAELRRFDCGDYFWLGIKKPAFLAWGDYVVLGSWGIDLAWEYQNGLAHSDIETRKEHPAWEWVEKRRRDMEPKPPRPPRPEQFAITFQ